MTPAQRLRGRFSPLPFSLAIAASALTFDIITIKTRSMPLPALIDHGKSAPMAFRGFLRDDLDFQGSVCEVQMFVPWPPGTDVEGCQKALFRDLGIWYCRDRCRENIWFECEIVLFLNGTEGKEAQSWVIAWETLFLRQGKNYKIFFLQMCEK